MYMCVIVCTRTAALPSTVSTAPSATPSVAYLLPESGLSLSPFVVTVLLHHHHFHYYHQGARIAQLVVHGLAVHGVAGSILLWGHFPVEGIFPLELTWVQTPFPQKLLRMRV